MNGGASAAERNTATQLETKHVGNRRRTCFRVFPVTAPHLYTRGERLPHVISNSGEQGVFARFRTQPPTPKDWGNGCHICFRVFLVTAPHPLTRGKRLPHVFPHFFGHSPLPLNIGGTLATRVFAFFGHSPPPPRPPSTSLPQRHVINPDNKI